MDLEIKKNQFSYQVSDQFSYQFFKANFKFQINFQVNFHFNFQIKFMISNFSQLWKWLKHLKHQIQLINGFFWKWLLNIKISKYISLILKYIKYINYKNQLYGSCDQKCWLWIMSNFWGQFFHFFMAKNLIL